MGDIPAVKPKKLLKLLEKEGFFVSRQSGSHIILHKAGSSAFRVTLPMHSKDLKKKTLLSILKQAGLSTNDLAS